MENSDHTPRTAIFVFTRQSLLLVLLIIAYTGIASGQRVGSIVAEIPGEVQLNQPFQVKVSLAPANPSFNEPVLVSAGRNPKVECNPSEFTIRPGQTQTVTMRVVESGSRLAVIYFYAANWESFDIPVVVNGVVAKLKTNLGEIKSNTVNNFVVSIVDKDGNPVRFEADTTLELKGTNVLLSEDQKTWQDGLKTKIKIGQTQNNQIKLKADWWTADSGFLTLQLKTMQGYSLLEDAITIEILPPWYVLFSLAVMGGLSVGFWQFMKQRLSSRRKLTRRTVINRVALVLLSGLAGGVLAYVLGDSGFFGIKAGNSGLRSYFILGLLFSYVGADVVLHLLTKRASS